MTLTFARKAKAPAFLTAREMCARKVFPVSEATILKIARENGVGKKMGRQILFREDDIQKLYEALPCPSSSAKGPKAQTGSCAVPSVDKALKKLQALLAKPPQKPSALKGKTIS